MNGDLWGACDGCEGLRREGEGVFIGAVREIGMELEKMAVPAVGALPRREF